MQERFLEGETKETSLESSKRCQIALRYSKPIPTTQYTLSLVVGDTTITTIKGKSKVFLK